MINVYISIAKCAASNEQHREAISFYKKALEFAWVEGNKDKELELYDEIGMMYFRLNRYERASHFHNKFAQGKVEGESGLKNMVRSERNHKRNPEPVN